MFWGCPSLRLGRAIAQLAGLLGPAALSALWSAACGGPATAPQPAGASRPAKRKTKSPLFQIGKGALAWGARPTSPLHQNYRSDQIPIRHHLHNDGCILRSRSLATTPF